MHGIGVKDVLCFNEHSVLFPFSGVWPTMQRGICDEVSAAHSVVRHTEYESADRTIL